jgi:hypothetical protein
VAIPPGLERVRNETVREYLVRTNADGTGMFLRQRTITFVGHDYGVSAAEIGEMFGVTGTEIVKVLNEILPSE